MTEIHSLSGAYAVDALDDLERAQFERHLAGCTACQEEVAGLREAAASLTSLSESAPPAALRDRVLAGITTVRPLPPEVAPTDRPPTRTEERPTGRLTRRTNLLVAAAVVVLALASAAAVWRPWADSSQSPSASPVSRVLTAADAEVYRQEFPDGSSATITRSKSLGQAVIVTKDMAPAPDGKVYEIWFDQPDAGMVPAGLMPDRPDNTLLLDGQAARATGLGITVEPAGGSPEPTSDPVALITFDDA